MPAPRGLIQHLDLHLQRSALLSPNQKFLLAISGGADSVALLRLLLDINRSKRWNWTLLIAHIDHGIRGASSKADALFVKQLAAKYKLPFALKTLKLGKSASESTARTARLKALKTLAEKHHVDAVVMAHHADDQAETVLLRLARGTGLDGLAGIPAAITLDDLPIRRPLLPFRRADLRAYLASIDQPFCEDETNAETHYTRNRLRADLMPHFEKLHPAAVTSLNRLAHLAGEVNEVVADAVRELLERSLILGTPTRIELHRNILHEERPFLVAELLRTLLPMLCETREAKDETVGGAYERLREAVRLIHSTTGGKTIEFPGHLHLTAGDNKVILAHADLARRKAKR